MKRINRTPRPARPLSDVVGPEDGIDPRFETRSSGRRGTPGRKSLQLCGQAARTLSSVLSSECDDDVLRDLIVVDVVPAPDSSRLLVTMALSPSAAPWTDAEVMERLHVHAARLRAAVASAIHRRRTPVLVHRLIRA